MEVAFRLSVGETDVRGQSHETTVGYNPLPVTLPAVQVGLPLFSILAFAARYTTSIEKDAH